MGDDLRAALARLLPRLRRFGVALTGSVSEADELVQRTCERALQRASQLRNFSRLDAWLYGIMRNLWTDETRARRIRQHQELTDAESVVGQNGEAAAENRHTLHAVRRALERLAPEQRAVLVLVCVDGMSYREAAETLDIPIGTVMSRLARGRAELYLLLYGRSNGDVTPLHAPKRGR